MDEIENQTNSNKRNTRVVHMKKNHHCKFKRSRLRPKWTRIKKNKNTRHDQCQRKTATTNSETLQKIKTKIKREHVVRVRGAWYACARASGVCVVVSGHPWCPRGSDCCVPGRFVAVCLVVRFWLVEVVEVFAVVSLGVSCFLPCRVQGHFVARWSIRLQVAAASSAHVSCSGCREPVAWVQMQLTKNRLFLDFLQ